MLAKTKRERKLDLYEPYLKQREFHALGATKRERGLIAANRVGKTECAAAEVTMHLVGEYPDDWTGKRFNHPTRWWAAGVDGTTVRDVQQKKLCGDPPGLDSALGTGYIPKDAIVGSPSRLARPTNLYDTLTVRCRVNGRLDESALSTLSFKSYPEGREGFQGEGLHGVWLDEQPPDDVYSEAWTRLATTGGHLLLTCTPLKGKTEAIARFMDEPAPERAYVNMGIQDAARGHDPERPHLGHFDPLAIPGIIAGYPAHEREARAYGVPQLGEGRVFLTPEDEFKIERPDVPVFWRKLWGLDFGGVGINSHPFAAVLLAHDTDYDIVYLLNALRLKGMTRLQHIPKIRQICALAPVAWPHDGNEQREGQGATVTLAHQYKVPMEGMPGLNMHHTHATWPQGGYSTAAAVDELDERIKTGRFKVVDTETAFFDEYRMYHRDKGLLVKENDDVLSAVFKGLMMLRIAKPVPLGGDNARLKPRSEPRPVIIDPWLNQPIDSFRNF